MNKVIGIVGKLINKLELYEQELDGIQKKISSIIDNDVDGRWDENNDGDEVYIPSEKFKAKYSMAIASKKRKKASITECKDEIIGFATGFGTYYNFVGDTYLSNNTFHGAITDVLFSKEAEDQSFYLLNDIIKDGFDVDKGVWVVTTDFKLELISPQRYRIKIYPKKID